MRKEVFLEMNGFKNEISVRRCHTTDIGDRSENEYVVALLPRRPVRIGTTVKYEITDKMNFYEAERIYDSVMDSADVKKEFAKVCFGKYDETDSDAVILKTLYVHWY